MTSRFHLPRCPGPRILGIAFLLTAVALISTGGTTGAAGPADRAFKRVPSETLVQGITTEEYATQQRDLHAWLLREMPAGAFDDPIRVRLTDAEQRELREKQDSRQGPAVVGRTKPVSKPIQFSPLDAAKIFESPRRVGHGVLRATADGGFVWAAAIRSEGASALRVHIKGLNLPANADLYFFNLRGQAFGPYGRRGPHGDGDFWTHTVMSAEGVLLLRHHGPNGAADLRRVSFLISDAGHIGPKFRDALGLTEEHCSYNEPCIENAECHNVSAVADAKKAVALAQWIAGVWISVCSGGLIADTDPGTQIPYFLTAHHCISKDKDAKNLETYFQYTWPCGRTDCPEDPQGTPVLGASVVLAGRTGDYSLLRLSGTPPSGSVFLGWNNAPVAYDNGAKLYRISHPNWAPQAYTEYSVNASTETCTGWPRGPWIYSDYDVGSTEGGSSGGPVVNSSGEIVGQLSGVCGYNPGDPCDIGSNNEVDGAFAYYYPEVEPFLNPGGVSEICDDGIDNDGDTLVDCDDPDCGGHPNCTVPEICDDGIDNDGDTLVDCNDPDCTGDPSCECLPAGASCTDDAECCSLKCRGAAGKKICR